MASCGSYFIGCAVFDFPNDEDLSSLVKKYGQQKNQTQAEAVNGMEYINGIQTYGTAGEGNAKVIDRMRRLQESSGW